jgi:hypothetical protein|nr:MAG TPA: hypothetical protein [Caudoviricetes sp.]
MSNNTLLFIIAVFVIAMFAILSYEFLQLNDFALFRRKPEPDPEHKHLDDLFRAEVMYTGVTLGSICELCPKTIFRVKDGHGGYFALDTEKVDEKKLRFYKTIFVKALDAPNYELEVPDPSLL